MTLRYHLGVTAMYYGGVSKLEGGGGEGRTGA